MVDFFIDQFLNLPVGLKYLMTFLVSMLPVIELRGAVPIGEGLGLNPYLVLIISIIGNLLPIPFIILFARSIIRWLKKTRLFSPLAKWLEKRVEKKKEKITRYEKFGLWLFVAIPLPGTGAWTGALVASFLDMRLKNSFPPIALGVVTAGIIMAIVTAIGSHALDFIF